MPLHNLTQKTVTYLEWDFATERTVCTSKLISDHHSLSLDLLERLDDGAPLDELRPLIDQLSDQAELILSERKYSDKLALSSCH